MVDDDADDADGRTTDHGHPISSPCEPNSSGELKNMSQSFCNLCDATKDSPNLYIVVCLLNS